MFKLFVFSFILLFTTFVNAAEKLEKITTMNEFEYFTQTYYLHPQPELIDSAITFTSSSGVASIPNAQAGLLMMFSCLFSQYDASYKENWKATIQTIEEPAKSMLMKSLAQSPAELLEAVPISPAKNDMNWACFFASGDFDYLNSIISALQYLDDREDINLFLTAASAKWSLSSNAKRHIEVRMALEAMKVGNVPAMRPIAKDILDKEPQDIREETVAVIKEQRKKGIWK